MNEKANFQRGISRALKNELSEAQVNQRIKNINLTKRLMSYERYISAVPKEERRNDLKNDWHPETPRINKNLSLSQWNREMKKWRKQVHAWGNMSEDVHKYICNLSASEKYIYLSKLKLPDLSQVEIKNLKKKNEEFSNRTLKNLLQIGDNNHQDQNTSDQIIDKPLFFLPQNFNGTILNNEFIIIKRNWLEESLFSLKCAYEEKYDSLYEKYYSLYFMSNSCNTSKEKEQSKNNDIVIYAKGMKGVTTTAIIHQYFERKKEEASQYLNPLCMKSKIKHCYDRGKTRKRF
ncbi:hypothetical protein, conserved [Plasmodium gonderi]|uniref:Histone RNA hairpin-binding protein RNA-binding domain-containing protein n=1 Tax=Plasmodium gonderi TaxID=77519 RepID=A0A1Y1JJI2_PLAGO|nr:hypothetical protein, conserved [Plasmodium gonderi]GAW81367.1 hypothetical protein, conserved [Plasmodium gonderi]